MATATMGAAPKSRSSTKTEALRKAEEAAVAATEALSRAQREAEQAESDSDIEVEWDIVNKALHEKAKAGGRGNTFRPAPRKEPEAAR